MGIRRKNIDLNDVVFENRNREYGAYPIRKGYTKRFWRSFLFAVLIVLATTFLLDKSTKEFLPPPPKLVKTIDVHIKDYKIPKPQEAVRTKDIASPKSKEDIKVKATKATTIPILKNIETIKNNEIVIAPKEPTNINSITVDGPVLDIKPLLKQEETKTESPLAHVENISEEKASTKVQTLPHYIGGDSAWYQYLRKNLNIQFVLRNGAMPSLYTAVVAFVVHPDSTTSDFKVVKDAGYGTGAEALRIVQKSGKWVPGTKNNKPVKFAQLQTIVFKINN